MIWAVFEDGCICKGLLLFLGIIYGRGGYLEGVVLSMPANKLKFQRAMMCFAKFFETTIKLMVCVVILVGYS